MATYKGHAQKGKEKGTITNAGKPYMEDFNDSFNNENLPVVEAEALRVREHPSKPDDEDIDITEGGDVMTMLDRFGADINKAFLAKCKRLETFTKSSVKTSHQKIEQLRRVQQRDSMFQHQQNMFQHKRASQSQSLKTLRQLLEQYIQCLDTMEKTHVSQQGVAQGELRQGMALFQKKILSDTQQQEMATVRKSLQTMLMQDLQNAGS